MLTDSAILSSIPIEYSINVYNSLFDLAVIGAIAKARNYYNNRKEVLDLWENRFPSFMKDDTQNVVGGVIGGDVLKHPVPSEYMLKAARRNIIPNYARLLSSIWNNKKLYIEPTDDICVDNHKQIILYGGCETSALCKDLLESDKLNFAHALLFNENTDEEYIKNRITSSDIASIHEERKLAFQKSRMAGAAGKWIIYDRSQEKDTHRPISYDNGTYFEDSAIITYYKNPRYKKKDILAISGTREIGTYLGDIFLKESRCARELQIGLKDHHIKPGDYFQVIIKFEMKPHRNGLLPGKKKIDRAKILDFHKIE